MAVLEKNVFTPEVWGSHFINQLTTQLKYSGINIQNKPVGSYGLVRIDGNVAVYPTILCYCDINGLETLLPLRFDGHFNVTFLVKDGERLRSFQTLKERYIAPAMRGIIEAIENSSQPDIRQSNIVFADLWVPELITDGSKIFRAEKDQVSVRCTMSYDAQTSGTKVKFDVLTSSFEYP